MEDNGSIILTVFKKMSSNACEDFYFKAEFEAIKAYAETLEAAKQLSSADLTDILKAINEIYAQETYTEDKPDIVYTEAKFLNYLSKPLTQQFIIGRSHSDQILIKLRLWLRFAIHQLKKQILGMLETGLQQIEYSSDVLLPFLSQTEQINATQPFSVWLLNHLESLKADFQKLQQLEVDVNMLPIYSNLQHINVKLFAQKLEFMGVHTNSATKFDIITQFLYTCGCACSHLSQLATDILIYATKYAILELPKFYEEQMISIKVHSTAIFSSFFSALTLVQQNSLQQTANLSQLRKYCMEVYEKLYKSLDFCKQMFKEIIPNEYAIEKLIASKALTTSWFNYLLKNRVQYISAQKYMKKINQYATQNSIALIDIPLEDLQAICPHFGNDIFQFQFAEADQICDNIVKLKEFLAANKQQLFISKSF